MVLYCPTSYVTLLSLVLCEPLLFYEQNERRAFKFKDCIQPELAAGHRIFPSGITKVRVL